jgi:hypothetical protein
MKNYPVRYLKIDLRMLNQRFLKRWASAMQIRDGGIFQSKNRSL